MSKGGMGDLIDTSIQLWKFSKKFFWAAMIAVAVVAVAVGAYVLFF